MTNQCFECGEVIDKDLDLCSVCLEMYSEVSNA